MPRLNPTRTRRRTARTTRNGFPRRGRAVVLAVALLVPLAGCGSAASPSPTDSPNSSSTPTASSSPSATGTASRTPSTQTPGASATSGSPSPAGSATAQASATWRYALQVTVQQQNDAAAARTVPVMTLQGAPGGLPTGVAARVDATLAATVQDQVSQFDHELAGVPAGGGAAKLVISERTVTQQAWLLAVRLDDAADYGGANPEVTVTSLVFDLRDGSTLTLPELFPGQVTSVDTALRAALAAMPDAFSTDVAATRASDLAWWPAPDGLHLVANQCQVVPCAAGPVEVTLGWAKLPATAQQGGQPLLPW